MILVVILILLSLWFIFFFPFARLKEATYKNGIMTVTYSNGSIKQYKGSVTVWHELPFMQRAGTFKESDLSDIYEYIKTYGNPYPTAHKTKIEQ